MKISLNNWKKTFPHMPNSKKYWMIFRDYDAGIMQTTLYYTYWANHKNNQFFIEQMEDFVIRSREVRYKMIDPSDYTLPVIQPLDFNFTPIPIAFGNCTTAATPVKLDPVYPDWYLRQLQEQQGNNPMRVTSEYNTPIASASVINAKSDEAYQREYLLSELDNLTRYSWTDPKFDQLRKLYNIGKSNEPDTAEDLIEKITKGQFKLDEKKMARLKAAKADDSDYDDDCDCEYTGSPFYGIIWDGVQPDRKGYDAAVKAYEKAKADTKRKIIVASPADGLQALLDLEAWLPTGKAN